MKTILKTSIRSIAVILSFFALTPAATASTNPTYMGIKNFSIEKVAMTKTFKFEMTNDDKNTATIAIQDIFGNVLFENAVKAKAHFAKVFNLNQLVDGAYFLTVTNRAGTTAQPIKVIGNDIQINNEEALSVFEPSIKEKGNLFSFYMPVQGEDLELSLKIYDGSGVTIYEEAVEVEEGFAKSYNLNELPHGSYQVVFDTGFASFTKNISVK